jgi:hypothetical protein
MEIRQIGTCPYVTGRCLSLSPLPAEPPLPAALLLPPAWLFVGEEALFGLFWPVHELVNLVAARRKYVILLQSKKIEFNHSKMA